MWSELKTLLHNVMTEWLNVGTDTETTQSIDEYISSIDCVITVALMFHILHLHNINTD